LHKLASRCCFEGFFSPQFTHDDGVRFLLSKGWAYNEIIETDSALGFAQNIQETFLTSTQGSGEQQTPKTLAIVNAEGFAGFIQAWEALCAEFIALIEANDDPDWYATLGRARSAAVSFEGNLDNDPSIKVNSAMDIGSFLDTFEAFCNPDPSSQLSLAVDEAQAAYKQMFVVAGVGPGTPTGTGMHITFVTKMEYSTYPECYEDVFGAVPPINGAPNYQSFLRAYYESVTPPTGTGGSVCLVSLEADRSATSDSELLIDPALNLVAADEAGKRPRIARFLPLY